MERILVVSGTAKGREMLTDLLADGAYRNIVYACSGGEARRLLLEEEYDLLLINAPLQDEFGRELALDASTKTTAGILMLVKADIADTIAEKVEDYGILVLPKPFNRQIFYQSLKMAQAAQKRLAGLKDENLRLKQKIEEIRLVDRAKCVLIEYLGLKEEEAHRCIEKQAMNFRCTRGEIAKKMIKTYQGIKQLGGKNERL